MMGMVPEISDGKLVDNIKLSKNVPLANDEAALGLTKIKLISHLKLKDPVTETYRSLRTNLSFSSLDNPIKSIMVTSAGPSEGKSLTCANLAISFAETGRKTLIIDADLRRPTQHKLFNIDKKPGLSNYMVEEATLDDIIYEAGIDYLNIIPVGKTPPNPAEILASQKFAELMKTLQSKFDVLLLDSPPVISVTDPILISLNVGGVLFVLKFGATDKQLAISAIDRLKKSRANIIGAVLNETQFHRGYGYYRYYNYYNYYYSGEGKKKKKTKIV
jgi:capsular exopolysaccharide synthesis family protein